MLRYMLTPTSVAAKWRLFGKEGILPFLFRKTRWHIAAFSLLQMYQLFYLKRAVMVWLWNIGRHIWILAKIKDVYRDSEVWNYYIPPGKFCFCTRILKPLEFERSDILKNLWTVFTWHRADYPRLDIQPPEPSPRQSIRLDEFKTNEHTLFTHTLLYLQPALMRTNIHTLSALPFNGVLHRACSAERRSRTVSNWFLAQDWAMYKTAPREYRSSFGHIQYLQLLRLTLMAAS